MDLDVKTSDERSGDAEIVARRLVMPRKLWDECVNLADVLSKAKKREILPADVAVAALEAGMYRAEHVKLPSGRPVDKKETAENPRPAPPAPAAPEEPF